MGNQALCQGENKSQSFEEIKLETRQRKVTQVQGLVQLDNNDLNKQSMLAAHYHEDDRNNNLNDWLESMHESVLISQINFPQEASTKFLSECEEQDDIESENQSQIDTKEINEYQKNYPYCMSNLDMVIINFYILKKQEFKKKLILGPPKQRIRWSCWQLMAFTPKITIISDQLSVLEENFHHSKAIKKDIHRTISTKNLDYFEDGDGKKDLEKVLIKLSKLYPKLGYCQGMNFLVGLTLIINNKEVDQSLKFIAQMMLNPKFLLYYIYSDQMPLVKLLEFQCQNEIKINFPLLYKKIYETLEAQNAFWVTKIIMTLFLYNFHINNVCRFWDLLLATNIFQISAIICSLLEMEQQKILQMQDLKDFIEWFDSFQNNELNDIYINQIIRQCYNYSVSKIKINQYAIKFCNEKEEKHQLHRVIAQDYNKMNRLIAFVKKDALNF